MSWLAHSAPMLLTTCLLARTQEGKTSAHFCLLGISVFKKTKTSPSLENNTPWGERDAWTLEKEKTQAREERGTGGEMLQFETSGSMDEEWGEDETGERTGENKKRGC